ncbi:MAG: hypothetical protein J5953_10660 [Prevotella sp.]|nr:hypothetical protein [Prevotella sp.]
MKKKEYQRPEIYMIPIYCHNPLLSHSPGNIDVGDDPWGGGWDGKEDDIEDDFGENGSDQNDSPEQESFDSWGLWKNSWQ